MVVNSGLSSGEIANSLNKMQGGNGIGVTGNGVKNQLLDFLNDNLLVTIY